MQYTVQQSWEVLWKEVNQYDEDMVKKWKEDIDTLLVFGGLFSAVVTGFTIESYKRLSEDPQDTTVALLAQISQQLRDPNMNITRPDLDAFHPGPSLVLINCFWFLSLILALMSALLALLCKQWLREHMWETVAHTRTTAESLALRQLRRDSLEKWRVPQFIALTPILLQVALLLFFAGLLDFAWNLNLALFVICLVASGIGGGLYIITALLPLVTNIYADICHTDAEFPIFRFVCPYKSPQAWAVYHFFCTVLRQLLLIGSTLVKRSFNWWMAVTPARDWSFNDMRVLKSYNMPPPLNLKVYELRALDWAARMLQHRPSMIPHFQQIFTSLSLRPYIIMTSVLNYWTLAMWEDFTPSDVQDELGDMTKFQETRRQGLGWYTTFSRAPSIPDPILHSKEGIQVLFFHQYWFSLLDNISVSTVRDLSDSISQFQATGLPKAINLRFFVPFSIVGKLWTHPNPEIQQESLSLIQICKDSWSAYPGPEEEGDERLAFLAALTRHLGQDDDNGHRSCLLTSPSGQEFIRFINDEIIKHRLHEYPDWARDPPPEWEAEGNPRDVLIEGWIAATTSIDGLASIPPHPKASARPSIEIVHHGLNGNAVPGQDNPDAVEMNQLGARPPDS
ncbi:hypothetical protein Moror_4919 [Moniliophthora roreri MCA 2997]|uniref:DUF6535 domain-containing protein n=2 Tax=Moniliophthora roreri TaxID=221103 RepID=V2X0Y7_MONRO|nr:hypothetical protein Moror_4919 [Moniliophthora roreri MCA 2997]